MGDVAIVSYNENGFWQSDLYCDADHINGGDWEWLQPIPDAFMTFGKSDGKDIAIARTKEKWPDAKLEVAEEVCSLCNGSGMVIEEGPIVEGQQSYFFLDCICQDESH